MLFFSTENIQLHQFKLYKLEIIVKYPLQREIIILKLIIFPNIFST